MDILRWVLDNICHQSIESAEIQERFMCMLIRALCGIVSFLNAFDSLVLKSESFDILRFTIETQSRVLEGDLVLKDDTETRKTSGERTASVITVTAEDLTSNKLILE